MTSSSRPSHRSPRLRRGSSFLWSLAALAALACAWGAQEGDAEAAPGDEQVVATVGDSTVQQAELMEASSEQLENVEVERMKCEAQAARRRHDVLSFTLEQLVRDRLASQAAAAAGVPVEEYLEAELSARREAVEQAAVDQFIDSNPRLAQVDRAEIAPQVRSFLAERDFYAELEAATAIERNLSPYRATVEAGNGVAKGGADAAVEIIEFSDFQCPYCKQVNPALQGVLDKYGDKVRLVFRQFPLTSLHPDAFKAAEASLCAEEQGSFWEMHDLMFEEQRQLSVAELKDKARQLGMDGSDFDECLDSDRYEDQVREDLRAGAVAGVTGTPALFINGRPYEGGRTVPAMSEVIDEELEAAGG